MKKIFGIIFYTLLLQASQEIQPLTLNDAISKLKTQNIEIKVADLKVDAAKADVSIASANHFGKLKLIQDAVNSDDAGNVFGFKLTSREATFGDFGFKENDPTNPNILSVQPKDLNYPDARTLFQTKLRYEIPLFTGFKISSYSKIMDNIVKIKSLEKDQIINEKVYQIKKSFYDMALLEESAKNLKTILNNIETLEDITNNMIEVGYAKKVDLLEVQAKKGNIQRLIRNINSNEKLLYHYISFLLNKKIEKIITPTQDIAMPIYSDDEILKNNLEIKKAINGLDIKNNMLSVAHSAFYPMVGAFAELSTADNSFFGDADDKKAYTVGARLTWNLFNGGEDYANSQKAQVEKLQMASNVELAKKGIILKVAKIRTEINTYDLEIDSLKKELKLSNEIYKNYEGRYKEKLSSMSDVIIKQSEQIEKILQLQKAKNKRNEKVFALEKLANGEEK